ncbi:DUF4365 domain-containing protein [Priestia megaterium]|uniref:DUF4365 domain-containing protein n=1 Tax=Priestia megaterium TaxID=1404 RepID=UPI0021ABA2E4|nr:DUF4365 domain-containing protein [Priestia megaterium]MCR8927458.1 DUF4365 domain-containing protein [Priestia megaterium]
MNNTSKRKLELSRIYSLCTEINAIWHPYDRKDWGIDGIIELLEEGNPVSTELKVGVRIETEPPYYKQKQGGVCVLNSEEIKNENFVFFDIPVILLVTCSEDKLQIYSRNDLTSKEEKINLLITKYNSSKVSIRQKLIDLANIYKFNTVTIKETLNKLKNLNYTFESDSLGKQLSLSGIDMLLSSLNSQMSCCIVNESRIFEMMRIIANKNTIRYNDHFLTNFIERFIIHISYCKVTNPFHEYFSNISYNYEIPVNFSSQITEYGKLVIYFLIDNLEEYTNLSKFSHMEVIENKSLFELITARIKTAEEEYFLKCKSPTLFVI